MLGGSSWLRVSQLSRQMVVLVRVRWLRGGPSSRLVDDWYVGRVTCVRSRIVGTNRRQSGAVDVLEALGDFRFLLVVGLVSVDVGHVTPFLACLCYLELDTEASVITCIVVVREVWPAMKVGPGLLVGGCKEIAESLSCGHKPGLDRAGCFNFPKADLFLVPIGV